MNRYFGAAWPLVGQSTNWLTRKAEWDREVRHIKRAARNAYKSECVRMFAELHFKYWVSGLQSLEVAK